MALIESISVFVSRLVKSDTGEPKFVDLFGMEPPSEDVIKDRERKVEAVKRQMGDKYLNVPFHKEPLLNTKGKEH